MKPLLSRTGALTPAAFQPDFDGIKDLLASLPVLVIGAGGLGCELLKDLALSGFRQLHVIDMDTIDVSNLNRQFLFRPDDVGKSKAEVAAKFIEGRVKKTRVVPYFKRIQDFDADFYRQFALIVCGLDSVEARRWINALIVRELYDSEDPVTAIPIIDGGTEGFKGQSRVIIPGQTSCFECSMDMFVKRDAFPICTIANTPRLPEHCIEWASVLEWPRVFGDRKMDTDNPSDLQWLFQRANERAKQFNIPGVTYRLTQGVVKNIIPAIASTNAVIAASCANEAFKMVTSCAPTLKTYMMYTGDTGVYTYTFQHERNPECPVCSAQPVIKLSVSPKMKLQELMDMLAESPQWQLKKCSLRSVSKTLYMRNPKALEEATRPQLEMSLGELGVGSDEELTATDAAFPFPIQIRLNIKHE